MTKEICLVLPVTESDEKKCCHILPLIFTVVLHLATNNIIFNVKNQHTEKTRDTNTRDMHTHWSKATTSSALV